MSINTIFEGPIDTLIPIDVDTWNAIAGPSGPVMAVVGTTDQINANTTGGTATISLPDPCIMPGDLEVTGAFSILNEYFLPTTAGTSGQVIGSTGGVNTAWQTPVTILTGSGFLVFNGISSPSNTVSIPYRYEVVGNVVHLTLATAGSPFICTVDQELYMISNTLPSAISPNDGGQIFITTCPMTKNTTLSPLVGGAMWLCNFSTINSSPGVSKIQFNLLDPTTYDSLNFLISSPGSGYSWAYNIGSIVQEYNVTLSYSLIN